MKIQGILGVTTQQELEHNILGRGCYDAAENVRIYKKWFTGARPRDLRLRPGPRARGAGLVRHRARIWRSWRS